MSVELMVVIPVRNEEHCIASVLQEWCAAVDAVEPRNCFLLIDDGSTDRTPEIIEGWRSEHGGARIEVVRQSNRGHGQTCLEGYREACRRGVPWVFQIDSDGQCDPAYFQYLWQLRADHDVIYGRRIKRLDGWRRVLASHLVRLTVRAATGTDCVDANVPYRLMRTANLCPLLDSIPAQFDLANIALAVQVKRANWREASAPIIFRPRSGGEPSVPLSRFAAKAVELFRQLRHLPTPVQQ